MVNKKIEPRWFLIKHKCGSAIVINTEYFFNASEIQKKAGLKFDVGYDIRCPSCQIPINQDLMDKFKIFLSSYKNLTDKFFDEDFVLRETRRQDLDSLLLQ